MASKLGVDISTILKSLLNSWNKTSTNKKYTTLGAVFLIYLGYQRLTKKKTKRLEGDQKINGPNRVKIDSEFFRKLRILIAIVLPGVRSKEFFLLVLHVAFLVSRTFLSIYVATLDGVIVKSLVDRNQKAFAYSILKWLGVAVPATYVNSMIRYLESKLAIAFRTRMTENLYAKYMEKETYYRVGNLDSRLSNADQCLTEDLSKFCSHLAHLHSQLSKPILDVVLMSWELIRLGAKKRKSHGGDGGGATHSTVLAFTVIYLTAKVLKLIQPNFGKLVAQQGLYEGDLRFVHSRLITNAEEVAFYRGHEIEHRVLSQSYQTLVKHMNLIFRKRIFYNMMEGFFMKYVWSATGLLMIAIPAFAYEEVNAANADKGDVVSTRTQDYVTSKQLLISGAEAIERIMLAFKEVTELAGYTSRVFEMVDVFDDVQQEKYKKQMITQDADKAPSLQREIDMQKPKGTVVEADYIKFENVPIVSPNGDILVKSLSFTTHPGEHLLITGPNGCGKSSLFRILGGLWPVFDGLVCKPDYSKIFYIPQRPYLPLGTLRDQIIYPHSVDDMHHLGRTDKDLEDIMGWVNLTHILQREGWDKISDWKDVLSGGEKQRVGMARLFYHKPKYAILDECTSAVSIDVEGKMYQHAIDIGITLLTVTHRPSLWKYHKYLLQFDGEGGLKFSELNAEARMSLKEEKSKLEHDLNHVPKMQKRLRELCQLLGEDSVLLEGDKMNGKHQ